MTACCGDYARARQVLETGDRDGMRRLAADRHSWPEMLYYLGGVDDPEIRVLIAANPGAPVQTDGMLSDDRAPEVRGTLARKVARRIAATGDGADAARDSARAILRRLAADQAVEVRRIVAEEVRSSAAIPRDLALALARDLDHGVCCPVLEFSPLLEDRDLLAIIDARLSSPALGAVARRAGLGEEVSDRVAGTMDVPAVADLLSNASARIREGTLDRIIAAAPRISAWHEPLVRRPDLSGSAIRRIAGFVADELLEAIAQREDLTVRMAEDLRHSVTATVARHALVVDEDAALIDALDAELRSRQAAGRLTPGFVAAAAEQQSHAEVWVALGLLAGVGRGVAHRVFASRNAKAIVALCWLASLPAWIIVTLQTRTGGIPEKECLRPRGLSDYPLSEKEMLWQLDLFGYRSEARQVAG